MAIASAIVGGLIAGAGAIGAAKIGSNATKTAANATTAAADRSADVIEQNYNKSAAALAPWQSQGLQANALINSALGLTPTQPAQSYGNPQATYQPAQQPNALAQFGGGPDSSFLGMGARMMGMNEDYSYLAPNAMGDMSSMGGGWSPAGGFTMPGTVTGYGSGTFNPDGTQVTTGTNGAPVNPQSAFDTFRNSMGYDFQVKEATRAVNDSWAGRGQLQSGAALKSLSDRRQGMADSTMNNWLGQLGNQQSLGFGAASAQAGVSQNVGNSLANIAMQSGQNQAALAAANGRNSQNLVSGLANIGAGIFGKSSGGGGTTSSGGGWWDPNTKF